MYARMTRSALAGVLALGLLAAVPAAAQHGGESGNNSGVNPDAGNGDEFGVSATAAFLAHSGGGGGSSGPVTCQVNGMDRPAHYRWNSVPQDDGTSTVTLSCVFDDAIEGYMGAPMPDGIYWGEPVWSRTVEASDEALADLLAEALARLDPNTAAIHTSPGDGNPSLVNFDTWFWLDESAYTEVSVPITDNSIPGVPLTVTVTATPTEDRTVMWDTGEDVIECNNSAPPEQCTASYDSSSLNQPHEVGGLPAYEITASYAYNGSYTVTLGGVPIAAGELGEIERSSVAYLPVEEAQALNTDGEG